MQADREWKYLFSWVRLIDDTFMNWEESEEKLQTFFEYINSVYTPIKWTMERKQDGKFPVFDIAFIQSVYAMLEHQIFTYILPLLKHGMKKTAAIHTLTRRALNYCSTQQGTEVYHSSIFI